MVLGTKIVIVAVGSVFATAAAGLVIQRSVIRNQGIEMTRNSMRAIVIGAENVRRSVSNMRDSRMFDDAALKADAGRVSDFRLSNIYKTIPVAAAWDYMADVAKKENY